MTPDCMEIKVVLQCGLQMYKAAVQQEEQNTPTFLRLQQQAEAKEEEERAEKQRRWEQQVASKKFWVSHAVQMLPPCICSRTYPF